jgi:signal transduction histidine kinase
MIGDFAAAVVALRWLIAACAFLFLGALYAIALMDLREADRKIQDLEQKAADQAEGLRIARRTIAILRSARHRRQPIIAGRVVDQ